MPSASGIRAGRAYVEMGADNSKLTAGLNAASAKLRAFGSTISALGKGLALVGGGLDLSLAGASKVFADVGSSLARVSAQTGASVESLSSLGGDVNQIGEGMLHMQRSLVEAASGSEEAQQALFRLGVTISGLAGQSPDEQFKSLADGVARISDPAVRSATALKIFGKGAADLLPMLEKGRAGIEALQQRNREFGLQISGEDATAAKRFAGAMNLLGAVMQKTLFVIGSAVAGALQPWVEGVTQVVVAAIKWAEANKPLVATITKIGGTIIGVGGALLIAGGAFTLLGKVMPILGAAFTPITAGFSAIVSLLGVILSPIGLVIGALAALGVWFFTATSAGKQALASLGQFFGRLWKDASTAIGGIADALSAGDLSGAAKILMTGLKATFLDGVAAISSSVGGGIGDLLGTLGSQIAKGDFAGAWDTVVTGMAVVWHTFAEGVVKAFKWAMDQVIKAQKFVADAIQNLIEKNNGSAEEHRKSRALAAEQITADDLPTAARADFTHALKLREQAKGQDEAKAAGQPVDDELTEALRSDADHLLKGIQADIDAARAKKGLTNASDQQDVGGPNKASDQPSTFLGANLDNFSKTLAEAAAEEKRKRDTAADKFQQRTSGGSNKAADAAADARKELEDLTNKAADAAAAAKQRRAVAQNKADDLGKAAPNLFEGLDRKFSTAGAFNVRAAAGLGGGGSAAERTAKNTEGILKATLEMSRKVGFSDNFS